MSRLTLSGAGAEKWVGFAKKQLDRLRILARITGLNFINKKYVVGDASINVQYIYVAGNDISNVDIVVAGLTWPFHAGTPQVTYIAVTPQDVTAILAYFQPYLSASSYEIYSRKLNNKARTLAEENAFGVEFFSLPFPVIFGGPPTTFGPINTNTTYLPVPEQYPTTPNINTLGFTVPGPAKAVPTSAYAEAHNFSLYTDAAGLIPPSDYVGARQQLSTPFNISNFNASIRPIAATHVHASVSSALAGITQLTLDAAGAIGDVSIPFIRRTVVSNLGYAGLPAPNNKPVFLVTEKNLGVADLTGIVGTVKFVIHASVRGHLITPSGAVMKSVLGIDGSLGTTMGLYIGAVADGGSIFVLLGMLSGTGAPALNFVPGVNTPTGGMYLDLNLYSKFLILMQGFIFTPPDTVNSNSEEVYRVYDSAGLAKEISSIYAITSRDVSFSSSFGFVIINRTSVGVSPGGAHYAIAIRDKVKGGTYKGGVSDPLPFRVCVNGVITSYAATMTLAGVDAAYTATSAAIAVNDSGQWCAAAVTIGGVSPTQFRNWYSVFGGVVVENPQGGVSGAVNTTCFAAIASDGVMATIHRWYTDTTTTWRITVAEGTAVLFTQGFNELTLPAAIDPGSDVRLILDSDSTTNFVRTRKYKLFVTFNSTFYYIPLALVQTGSTIDPVLSTLDLSNVAYPEKDMATQAQFSLAAGHVKNLQASYGNFPPFIP